MSSDHKKSPFDNVLSDEPLAVDTSMFSADEIVKGLEEKAAQSKKAQDIDRCSAARKKFEAMQEQKELEADLYDLDDYSLDD